MKELKEENIQEKHFKPREFKNSVATNNKSGYRGVYFDKTKQKWRAQIRFDNRCYKLGLHPNKEDAILARQEAELKLYGKLLDKDISIAENNIVVNKIKSKNKKVKENKDILLEENG
jgi:hypothetical protein